MRGRTLVPGALAAAVLVLGQTAHADSVGHRLSRARETRQRAEATVRSLEARLGRLQKRLDAGQERLDRATADMLAADRGLHDATIKLDLAKDTLVGRVRAAYEYGPATALSMLLSAESPGALVSVNEFTSRVISQDMDAVNRVENAQSDLRARQEDLAARRADIRRQEAAVRAILRQMQTKLAHAREAARRANLKVSTLRHEQARLAAAQQREAAREGQVAAQDSADSQLIGGSHATPGFNEPHLLSLLGPTRGRTCSTPPGLRDTGQRLAGKATWYGPGFAGNVTASGAIFDPRLFTAAHRTLPFGTFVRVHYAGKCAIVLINDRGPYIYDRVIDLSKAAGKYLGIGVTPVTGEILVPA